MNPSKAADTRIGRQPIPASPRRRSGRALAAGLLSWALLAGCATPPGEIFPPVDPPLEWPPAGSTPRIRYVGQLSSAADLKPGRSGWDNFWGAVMGRETPPAIESPMSAVFDGNDRLYVADSAAGCVHVFGFTDRKYFAIGSEAGIESPVAVALGSGRLYVADAQRGVVVCTDTNGTPLRTIGEGELKRPSGLCYVPSDDSLFVSDAAAHNVLRYSSQGRLLAVIGSRGKGPGQFNFPTNLFWDRDERLYVSDSLNFRIQILNFQGEPLAEIGSKGNRPGDLSLPKGVAVDSSGHVYVVDAHFENVQVFDRAGQILLPFGQEGNGPGEFWLPAGIHIDAKDRIWICDSYNHRVQVFQYLSPAAAASAPQTQSGAPGP